MAVGDLVNIIRQVDYLIKVREMLNVENGERMPRETVALAVVSSVLSPFSTSPTFSFLFSL